MMRLFIAMPLPRHIEEALARVILVFKESDARVKWVEPKNIHLTMKFLGETDEQMVPEISQAIETVSRKYNAVSGFINKVGAFPNPNKPRVVWAGMAEEIADLEKIATDIETEMEKLGFEKENRKFKSHLTLGRVKDSRQLGRLPSVLKGFELAPEKITFDRIVLFKSTLTPGGPIYDRLYEAKLKSDETFS
jgi:2'-5' RNA ligase